MQKASLDGAGGAVLWRADTLRALGHSLGLAGLMAALSLGIALPLGWALVATDLPGRRWWRVIALLPLAVPSYVAGYVVQALFGPVGLLADALAPLGVQRLPGVEGWTGTVLSLLFSYPYALLPVLAALERVPGHEWEAARSLGCSGWQAARLVIWPRLRPAAWTGGLLVALYSLGDFGAVSLMRFPSLSYLIYLRYSSLFGRGEAVWLGLLLAATATVGVAALGRARSLPAPARGGGLRPVSLGRWRWPLLAGLGVVGLYGVVAPLMVLSSWLVRGLLQGNSAAGWGVPLLRSAGLAAGAASLVLVVALGPALVSWRGRGGTWVRMTSRLGYALPGIVVALSLVSIARGTRFYQTGWLLLGGYALRYLPAALGSLEDGLAEQSPRIFEAARGLGAGPAEALWRAVLPAARAALVAAWAAVFVAVLKELPLTLLLAPLGWETLATRIWSRTEEAFLTAAAAPALALLLLAAVGLHIGPRRKT